MANTVSIPMLTLKNLFQEIEDWVLCSAPRRPAGNGCDSSWAITEQVSRLVESITVASFMSILLGARQIGSIQSFPVHLFTQWILGSGVECFCVPCTCIVLSLFVPIAINVIVVHKFGQNYWVFPILAKGLIWSYMYVRVYIGPLKETVWASMCIDTYKQ